MDKVQIYEVVLLTINVLGLGYLLGTSDETRTYTNGQRAWTTFLAFFLGLPIYGRIFNWW